MTAQTRASSIGVARPFTVLVIPDGAVDQEDRQTNANAYGGILSIVAQIWIPQDDQTTAWTEQTDNTTVWKNPLDQSTTWTDQ